MHADFEPSITVRALQPLIAALETLGHDTGALLAACGIPRAALDNADQRVPHTAMMCFWEAAMASTGDGNLGMHLGLAAPIQSFGVHAYALRSSPTLREAYRRAGRYQRLIHEATDLQFVKGADEGVLVHSLPGGRPVSRQPAEFLVTLWVRFGRLITGTDWSPNQVHFAHGSPPDTSEHEHLFRAPVLFASGRNAMHIPNHVLDAQNAGGDLGLVTVLDDYAERLLAQMPASSTLSQQVRQQLIAGMKGGVPTAEDIARTLHVSVRTLHRNLQREGVTFRELLDQLRHEQATDYLADPTISVSETAFLLGFSELSSFYRAFRRWTGMTPAEFRANALRPARSSPST